MPKQTSKILIAIVVAVFLLFASATTVFASVSINGMRVWLNELWHLFTGVQLNQSQTQILCDMVVDSGQYVIENGAIITVESILVRTSSVQVMISVEVDGLSLSENRQYGFDGYFAKIIPSPLEKGASGDTGVSQEFYMVDILESKAYLVFNYSGTIALGSSLQDGYTMVLDLYDFKEVLEGTQGSVQCSGQWSLQIPLTTVAQMDSIFVEYAHVTLYATGEAGVKTIVDTILSDLRITSTGICFSHDNAHQYEFVISALMGDGTIIEATDGAGYLRPGGKGFAMAYSFLVPINIADIACIRVGESTIQIQ